jgi:hypothetical protein
MIMYVMYGDEASKLLNMSLWMSSNIPVSSLIPDLNPPRWDNSEEIRSYLHSEGYWNIWIIVECAGGRWNIARKFLF